MKKHKEMVLINDLSNEDYHADKSVLSSSSLKPLLKDPELFYLSQILGNVKKKTSNALDLGTALHTAILEPEKFEQEITTYEGGRTGKAWKEFKEANKEKIILTQLQSVTLNNMIETFKKSDYSKKLLADCNKEITLFYSHDGIPLKVRADAIHKLGYYIVDLKSMSGHVTVENFKKACRQWLYDLSAAMYMYAFNKYFEKQSIKIRNFYFIVISSDYNELKIFKCKDSFMQAGFEKYVKCLKRYKKYQAEDWASFKYELDKEMVFDLESVDDTELL